MNGCAPSSRTSLTSSRTMAVPRMVRQLKPRASTIGLKIRAEQNAMQVDPVSCPDDGQYGQNGHTAELRCNPVERPPCIFKQDRILTCMRFGVEPVVVLVDAGEQTGDVLVFVPEAQQGRRGVIACGDEPNLVVALCLVERRNRRAPAIAPGRPVVTPTKGVDHWHDGVIGEEEQRCNGAVDRLECE